MLRQHPLGKHCLFTLLLLVQCLVSWGQAGVFPPPEESQRKVLRAIRATERPRIDGKLDEPLWHEAPYATGFLEVEPNQGEPGSQPTHVRVTYDDRFLYVGFTAYDSIRTGRYRVPSMRRDFDYFATDLVSIIVDPFRDFRSAASFQASPLATQRDLLVFDGDNFDRDWDGLWKVRTQRGDSAWTAEMAIPWSTIRYPRPNGTDTTVWGLNFARTIRRGAEQTSWALYPRGYTPYRMVYAGKLVGLEPPDRAGIPIRVQPFATGVYSRTKEGTEETTQNTYDVGGEVRWSITPRDLLEVTFNTDFAQADVDRAVNNLSRFSVFFPERRQFFLENANLFAAGEEGLFQPFFSRQIGLDANGNAIPIDVGGRYISRSKQRNLGALYVRQREQANSPAVNFGVLTVQPNLGKQSRVAGLVTWRNDEATDSTAAVTNVTYTGGGVFRPNQNLTLDFDLGNTQTYGQSNGNGWGGSAEARYEVNGGFIGGGVNFVTRNYNPRLGFVGRSDVVNTSFAAEGDWRPKWLPSFVRNLEPGVYSDLFHQASTGRFQEGNLTVAPLWIRFQGNNSLGFLHTVVWQQLDETFEPLTFSIDSGAYRYYRHRIIFDTDASKKLSGGTEILLGQYYDGTTQDVSAFGRFTPVPYVALSANYTRTWLQSVGSAADDLTLDLFTADARFSLNARVQLYVFFQYNSFDDRTRWNVRFSWEYLPLSYVFLVFNDNNFREDIGTAESPLFQRNRSQQAILKLSLVKQL